MAHHWVLAWWKVRGWPKSYADVWSCFPCISFQTHNTVHRTQNVMTPEENNPTPNPKSCLVWHNSIFIKTSRRLSHRLQQWAPARWQLLSRLRCDNRQQKYVHNTTGCVQEMTIKLLAQKLSFTHNLPPWQEPLRWSSISSSLCLQLHLEKYTQLNMHLHTRKGTS